MTDNTKRNFGYMSQLIFTMPIQLGNDKVSLSIEECFDGFETFYQALIPAIGCDKTYTLRIEPFGDVYFKFDGNTPSELRDYEYPISAAIFNYHYFEGLT